MVCTLLATLIATALATLLATALATTLATALATTLATALATLLATVLNHQEHFNKPTISLITRFTYTYTHTNYMYTKFNSHMCECTGNQEATVLCKECTSSEVRSTQMISAFPIVKSISSIDEIST